jgi:hypothetical protein
MTDDRPSNVRPLIWRPRPDKRIDPKIVESTMTPEHIAATDALVAQAQAFEKTYGYRYSWQCFSDHADEPVVDALAMEVMGFLKNRDLDNCRLIAALVAAEAQLEAASFAYGGVNEHMRNHQPPPDDPRAV